jgi:predicted acylesterase/phospholipase RssA
MTKSPKSLPAGHETRLALVLNGGVSLAVWMGGVTHELDLLQRATSGAGEETVDPRDKHVFRVWQEVAASCPRTRIVIDVVAGSSAGGLNGMLLATAIGRGAPLPDLRTVWRESAALDKLLMPKPPPHTSVLSGASFEEKVREAVEKIGFGGEATRARVTLFLPATSLAGRARLCTDGFGNDFEVRDHRRLYRFEHDEKSVRYSRNGERWALETVRQADFVPENADALVQAARATGSFPVAFPPVNESPLMRYRVRPETALDDPASFVMDGGVLNNAPFAPVLHTIANRTADTPYRRVVVYVAPSSGRGEHDRTEQIDENTAWPKVAFRATSFPQEADFRSSVEELTKRLSGSVRSSHFEVFARAMSKKDGGRLADRLRVLAEQLLYEYRYNRVRGVIHDLRARLAENTAVTFLGVTREASVDQINAILSGDPPPNWIPLDDPKQITEPFSGGVWHWGFIPAERVLQSLSEQLHSHLSDGLGEAQQKRLIEGTQFITECLRNTTALMEAHVGQILLRVQGHGEPVLSDERAAYFIGDEFSAMDIPGVLGELVEQAALRYVRALRAANIDRGAKRTEQAEAEAAVACCLAVEVVTRAYAAPSKVIEPPVPEFEFLRLGPDKMSRALYEDRFADMGDRKLYGIRFQHFGGFFKSDWRKSDFTWGRLDAAHHLLRLFIPESESVRRDFERKLHDAILAVESPDGAQPREWMTGNLEELLGSTDNQLLKKATDTPEGQKVLDDATESALEMFRVRPRLIKKMLRYLSHRALRAYLADPPGKPAGAVKRGALVIGVLTAVLFGALAFGLGFGISYAFFD